MEDEDQKRENAEIESFELEEKRIVEEVERQVRGVKGSIYLFKYHICVSYVYWTVHHCDS